MKRRFQVLRTTLFIALLFVVPAICSHAYEVDTTQVRPVQRQSKSIGAHLLHLPGTVLLLPVELTKGIVGLGVNEVFYTERSMRFIASLSRVDRVWGMYPVVGFGSNSGWKYGAAFTSKKVFTKGERFKVKGYYSTHKYQKYYVRYQAPNKLGAFKRLTVLAQYRFRPRETFYGLGNNSRNKDEAAFTLEESLFGLWWHHIVRPKIMVTLGADYRVSNLYDGDNPDIEGELAAIREHFDLAATDLDRSRVWTGRVSFVHDWRNHKGQPSRGGHETFTVRYNRGAGHSSDLEYLTVDVDVRHYLNLFKKRLLAFRLKMESIDPLGNGPDAPVYLRTRLGGQDDLRGYRSRRLVDNNLALASIEYRWPVADGSDAFAFLDEARVFDSFTDESTLRQWRYSAGFGLRVFHGDELLLITTVAFSDEGARFYLSLGEEL